MITNGTICLITLEERHLEPMRQLRNSPETWHFLTSVVPINISRQKIWFEQINQDGNRMYFAIEKKGIFVGYVRTDEWDKVNQSIRIGIDIVPKYRRRGIATKVYDLLLNYLFNQLNIHRIWLLVADYNIPALSLYEKLGFVKEGMQREALFRDGKRHSYIMMSKLQNEYTDNK